MRKLFILTVIVSVCAIMFPHLFAQAQDQEMPDRVVQQERDLSKVFRRHERVRLNRAEVAEQVRKEVPLSIYTSSVSFDLLLKPHDMRGPNYRAVEADAVGVERAVEMGAAVRTFKGTVVGRDDSQARFTVDESTLEGIIITPEERYVVEPVSKYSAGADAMDFVVYRSSDLIEGQGGVGQGPIDRELRHTAEEVAPKVDEVLTTDAVAVVRDVELATETDAEFVTALGGSAAANNEILSIMNMVEGVYQQQNELTFTIVFQHTWTNAASDPYSRTAPGGCYNNTVCGGPPPGGLDAKGILNEFMEYWNTNFPPASPNANNPARDLAHMWTGKDVDGGTIGLAWIGVVCQNANYSYGFSQRIANDAVVKHTVTAHEIGHNFNASHSDGQAGCANTIMNSSGSPNSIFQFCPYSVNQIKAHANANPGCLSAATTSCSFTIAPTGKASVAATGASDRVTITTTPDCAWTARSNVAWITITTATGGTGSGAISYTVAANTSTATRTGTMTIAGQTFTVTQVGTPTSAFTISGKITVGTTATGLAGVTVKLTGTRALTRTTDARGAFSFTGLPTGNYRVTPTKLGYLFTPANRVYNALSANQTTANFTATARTFTITAKATSGGLGLAGVTMRLTGSRTLTCTTAINGTCLFSNLPAGGSYTVTPSRTGFAFTPARRVYAYLTANATASFTASPVVAMLGSDVPAMPLVASNREP
ncbi:MAG: M12 family metallo-peptidase [Pyrinomonadaceae bacterium]